MTTRCEVFRDSIGCARSFTHLVLLGWIVDVDAAKFQPHWICHPSSQHETAEVQRSDDVGNLRRNRAVLHSRYEHSIRFKLEKFTREVHKKFKFKSSVQGSPKFVSLGDTEPRMVCFTPLMRSKNELTSSNKREEIFQLWKKNGDVFKNYAEAMLEICWLSSLTCSSRTRAVSHSAPA